MPYTCPLRSTVILSLHTAGHGLRLSASRDGPSAAGSAGAVNTRSRGASAVRSRRRLRAVAMDGVRIGLERRNIWEILRCRYAWHAGPPMAARSRRAGRVAGTRSGSGARAWHSPSAWAVRTRGVQNGRVPSAKNGRNPPGPSERALRAGQEGLPGAPAGGGVWARAPACGAGAGLSASGGPAFPRGTPPGWRTGRDPGWWFPRR